MLGLDGFHFNVSIKQTFVYSRNTSVEKTTQHNAYELSQLKNDYAVCKQQRALLEEDLLDQRQEITEFECLIDTMK
jgi:hypothetical protein